MLLYTSIRKKHTCITACARFQWFIEYENIIQTQTHTRTHANTHTHTHTEIVLLEMAIYLGASLERFSYYVHHWNDSAIRCIIGTIQLLGASLERFSY